MKRMAVLMALLLWALPAAADTYSWVDDQGTYNFTEDLSRVPKKYRKKVKRTSDVEAPPDTAVKAVEKAKAGEAKQNDPAAAKTADKAGTAAPAGKQLYAGKTFEAWRAELGQYESELEKIDQKLQTLRVVLGKPDQLSVKELSRTNDEYNSLRTTYTQKYAAYNELVEAARKAGLTVTIKK